MRRRFELRIGAITRPAGSDRPSLEVGVKVLQPGHPPINAATSAIVSSGIRVVADRAAALRRAGREVFPFHLGEPDFDTPEAIKAATVEALRSGPARYPPTAGIPPLREAIASHLNSRYAYPVTPDDVIVTVGACEALTLALFVALAPGDEVLVPTPCWPNYLQTPRLFGATVRTIPQDPSTGFRIEPRQLLEAIGPSTRAVLLNQPSNPTGRVMERQDIAMLVDGLRERGVWLIADEIYHDLVYAPHWTSVLDVVREGAPIFYVNGFSKSYAMTGWRLGYVVTSGSARDAVLKVHQALVTSVAPFTQVGAAHAFNQFEFVAAMREALDRRRARTIAAIHEMGLECTDPDGAFYVFPTIPDWAGDATEFTLHALEAAGVAIVPGDAFGSDHADRFRLSFACDDATLERGLAALARVVSSGPP